MDLNKLKDMLPLDRQAALTTSSIGMEEQPYMKPLSDAEMNVMKDEITKNMILQDMILDEIQDIKEEYKNKLEPIREKIKEALQGIRFGAIQTKGVLYKIPDYDTKMIHFLDADANLVSSRMMKPEERQLHINSHTA